jgi:MFS family permease
MVGRKNDNKNKKHPKIKILILCLIIIFLIDVVSNINPYENYNLSSSNVSESYISKIEPERTNLPFERTTLNDTIIVIDAMNLSFDEQLTAVSLQGVVNKNKATIYVVYSDLELQWLECLRNKNPNTIIYLELSEAINRFSGAISGVVLYNDNHVSLNLATTISGLENAIMVKTGSETYGLDIVKDTTKFNDKSYYELFNEYFDDSNREIIAHFAPHDIRSRDYVIQQEMFCFYKEPGPFSWPGENFELVDIVKDFSNKGNGINRWLFGWFQTPTITEEDYAVQLLSHYGVTLIPNSNVPNLSLLQALNITLDLSSNNRFEKVAKNKVYITFGMADGDSLDFMYKNMNSHWGDPTYDKLPISWSVNPILQELAPGILQYYSDSLITNHSFIAGGSGMGIVFPDFFIPELLPNYIEKSRSLGLDKVWLLNSYTPYETRYSENVLSEYAKEYEGIVLDYGSMPVRNPYWKLSDKPFVRSLHYMGDNEDFRVKLGSINLFSDQPLFLYITLYPWSDLDIPEVLDSIEYICGDYEFVNLDNFFLMISDSSENLNYFDDTRRSLASTSQYKYKLQDIMINEGWIILGIISTAIIWFIIPKKEKEHHDNTKPHLVQYIYYGAANSLYLSIILWVLYQNYWQWLSLGIIPIIAIIYPVLRKKNVEPKLKAENYIIYGFLLGLSGVISVIFPIALIIGFLAYFKIVKANPKLIIKTYPVSIIFSFMISFLFWTAWILLPICLLILLTANEIEKLKIPGHKILNRESNGHDNNNIKNEQKRTLKENENTNQKPSKIIIIDFFTTFLPAAFFSLLILPIFYLDMILINVIMDYNSYSILILTLLVIIIAIPIGTWLIRYYKLVTVLYPISWMLIIALPFSFILPFSLVIIQAMTYCLAKQSFDRYIRKSKKYYQIQDFGKNLAYLPIIIGLLIMFPPMFFSVYIFKLDDFSFFFLYLKPFLMSIITFILIIWLLVADRLTENNEIIRTQGD